MNSQQKSIAIKKLFTKNDELKIQPPFRFKGFQIIQSKIQLDSWNQFGPYLLQCFELKQKRLEYQLSQQLINILGMYEVKQGIFIDTTLTSEEIQKDEEKSYHNIQSDELNLQIINVKGEKINISNDDEYLFIEIIFYQ